MNFTPEEMTATINEILKNPSYAENTAKASAIFNADPMSPKQRATYWIDHVIKYGGEHLHSHGLDIPWYQYLMLDIFLFLLVLAIVSVAFAIFIIKLILSKLNKTNKQKEA